MKELGNSSRFNINLKTDFRTLAASRKRGLVMVFNFCKS